jgi:DNA polymerase-3 subunit chi
VSEIAFHFGAPDKVAYACRLLRKATSGGLKVTVLGTAEVLRKLDQDLWGVGPTDFVTHCTDQAQASVVQASLVVLSESLQDAVQKTVPLAPILVNLGTFFPDGFERFERVIEVVSTDDDDRAHARDRWKQYTKLGYTIVRHDLALRK